MQLRAQGATQLAHAPTYCPMLGQGATEYLVLLAVVLIVALVSVALLGFFPGMASDAQITQSQMYWQSASPIAIVEWDAVLRAADGYNFPYFRIRNNGMYPIRLTGVIGGDGVAATQFYVSGVGGTNITDYYYMAPGEEKYFGYLNPDRRLFAYTTGSGAYYLGGAKSVCQDSTASPGTLDYDSIGFIYTEYIEGQQITKRQVGKSVIIKCRII